jgi:hypothetical protein
MEVGDLVIISNPFMGKSSDDHHHGVVLRINKSCGDLSGHVLVQWFGLFNNNIKAHHPQDLAVLKKNK